MRWWIVLVVMSAVAYWPARSHACQCPKIQLWVKSGHSGESVVPRNRAIELEGHFLPDSLVLQTQGGSPHAFTLRTFRLKEPCRGSFVAELIPNPAFEPNTQYELRAAPNRAIPYGTELPDEFVLRFSTSDELLPDPELEPPKGKVTLSEYGGETSCGWLAAVGCLSVDDPTDVEVVMRNGDTIFSQEMVSDQTTHLNLSQMPTCIDLQRRAPTGRRSEPLSICGKDVKLVALEKLPCDHFNARVARRRAALSDDYDSPPTAADAGSDESRLPEHTKYNCAALAHGRPENSRYALLGLLTGFLLWRRRRRAS